MRLILCGRGEMRDTRATRDGETHVRPSQLGSEHNRRLWAQIEARYAQMRAEFVADPDLQCDEARQANKRRGKGRPAAAGTQSVARTLHRLVRLRKISRTKGMELGFWKKLGVQEQGQ